MSTDSIIIKETTNEDLESIISLWNNGEVMFYVGFPQGLGITMKEMKTWFAHLQEKKEKIKHYSIYTRNLGFCGETFYEIDTVHDLAAMDIKILPKAQGKGIAHYALRYALSHVFDKELAKRAYVDPNPNNSKAWRLYKKLGFISKERPNYLEPSDSYLEVTKETFINL
jgi:RimJ/RimL family protein N-acetyltransferase